MYNSKHRNSKYLQWNFTTRLVNKIKKDKKAPLKSLNPINKFNIEEFEKLVSVTSRIKSFDDLNCRYDLNNIQ